MKKIDTNLRFLFLGIALLVSFCQLKGQCGLVAYYKFEDNGADSSGNSYNATISATPTFGPDRFGHINSALSVQSTSDAAIVPGVVFNNFIQGTLSLWVKTSDATGSGNYWACPTLFGSDLSGYNDTSFGVYSNSGAIGIWAQMHGLGSGNVAIFQSTKIINDNLWHFIVVTINDDSLCKLYVDDSLIGSVAAGTPLNPRPYMIMDKGPTGGWFLSGLVNDVRINNCVLSKGQIDSLYLGITTGLGTIPVDNNSFSVSVFPNPAHDLLNIELADGNNGIDEVKLYNSLGQEVISEKNRQNNVTKIDVGRLAKGAYLIKVTDIFGRNYRAKEIIE